MEQPQGSAFEMADTPVAYMTLDEAAQGTIDIKETQQERLEEFVERVGSGEFHTAIEGRLPCGCIDGRGGMLRPNSAGGTESLMVADDLVSKRFAVADGTTLGAYENILTYLDKLDYDIGGHDADHKPECGSGCGANDKLETIYSVLANRGDVVRTLAAQIGVEVDDNTHALIVKNAASRTSFSDGEELLNSLETIGGSESIDRLTGDHNEVVAIINTQFGTTLDRSAILEEFGPDYQAFNVDVWAFAEGAKVISVNEEEQAQKSIALAYYNIATAMTLCGPGMRVVVL